ncbi:MAG: glutathione S-transferase family protein [Myxococcota bacterium]
MTMKFYFNPESRALITRRMLELVGAEYETVLIDFTSKQNKAPEFLNINPAGKLPALIDGDVHMYENVAICLYLADKFPQAGLTVDIGSPLRGRYLTLAVYATSQLEPAMGDALLKVETSSYRGWTNMDTCKQVLIQELGDGPFLLGAQFTTADVLVGETLGWYRQFDGVLPPVLAAYTDRVLGWAPNP